MSRWPCKPLGDLCKIITGGTPSRTRSEYFGGNVPWVKITDMLQGSIYSTAETLSVSGLENSSAKLLPIGTVLVSIFATIGRTAVLKSAAATNQAIAGIVPNDSQLLDPEFLRYFLDSKHKELNQIARGVAQPNINQTILKALELPLPPLPEQRRIVDRLNHAASIRLLRRQAMDTARALIPALFVEMFGVPGRNEKGWVVLELGDLIVDGPQNGLYKHASAYGEGTPILRIDAFYDGAVTDISALRRLRLTAEEITRYGLNEGDIVVNRVNSPEYLGKSAIVSELPEPIVFESNMMRVSVDSTTIQPRYLIQYLQTGFIKQQILGKAKHAINQSSINQQDVKSFPVMVPPLPLQQTFAARVADLQALITQQERHLAQADALLQSLMARYFGGVGVAVGAQHAVPVLAQPAKPIREQHAAPLRKSGSDGHGLPLAAEPLPVYTSGGQTALPAANQPVPGGIPACLLAAMQSGHPYSRAELLAATGISEADWTWAIRQLKEERKVVQEGEKRGARYRR